ncbi:NAD(P)(+) transhydrogenase (Re/Si-specific) subunit beta [Marinicella sp. W31]|uniref:NAD(P)(+) transhydrogenase (Re/Si-specific) subunit beta n=1 Tax=Marinicella sp. W31 TaxID=3023713 RepID=UPI0037574927
MIEILIKSSYLLAAFLFITGLRRMSSPTTARNGIVWAGIGMLIAVIATFLLPDMHNMVLILAALISATLFAWISGKKVAMTSMPQMVALYNGMGGGSAAFIGAMALFNAAQHLQSCSQAATVVVGHDCLSPVTMVLAVVGVFIGAVSLSGSLVAFAKLQGWLDRTFSFPGQHLLNGVVAVGTLALGLYAGYTLQLELIWWFFGLSLLLGIMMTLPIGGADMPVVISLYNALTGLAVSFEGYVIQNEAMIVAGMLVGAAGTLLTQLMAKAMNRSLWSVLLSSGGGGGGKAIDGEMREIQANDAAIMMAYAERVIVIPGYGMAVAQAQHKLWEMTEMLLERGVDVKFAIHPVAGRMPGHMNVLLAEAGVPYDLIEDLEDINAQFSQTDVALVIGANDVVNPVAKTDPDSPIYGMPILNVDEAKNSIVIKRGKGTGFAGIQNALFFAENNRMLYGDAQAAVGHLIQGLKQL